MGLALALQKASLKALISTKVMVIWWQWGNLKRKFSGLFDENFPGEVADLSFKDHSFSNHGTVFSKCGSCYFLLIPYLSMLSIFNIFYRHGMVLSSFRPLLNILLNIFFCQGKDTRDQANSMDKGSVRQTFTTFTSFKKFFNCPNHYCPSLSKLCYFRVNTEWYHSRTA